MGISSFSFSFKFVLFVFCVLFVCSVHCALCWCCILCSDCPFTATTSSQHNCSSPHHLYVQSKCRDEETDADDGGGSSKWKMNQAKRNENKKHVSNSKQCNSLSSTYRSVRKCARTQYTNTQYALCTEFIRRTSVSQQQPALRLVHYPRFLPIQFTQFKIFSSHSLLSPHRWWSLPTTTTKITNERSNITWLGAQTRLVHSLILNR